MTLAACGAAGQSTPAPTPTASPTQIIYHLDADVRRSCNWQNNGPATCQVYVTVKPDTNFTFSWQAISSPSGASFSPDSGSLAPGETSDLITVISPTMFCPITFRFVDTQHQLEADSQFNPCNNT
jgi:hypothetical protein